MTEQTGGGASGRGRRSFLKRAAGGALGAGAAGLGGGWIAARPARAAHPDGAARPGRVARNVIFMVSDGMSWGTLGLADQVCRMRHGRPSHWARLMADVRSRRALQETSALDSAVTDSGAAGSAWGTGVKTPYRRINMRDDTTPTGVPIWVHAAQQGKRTGLVTTTRVTHATPASFVASAAWREQEGPGSKVRAPMSFGSIAEQILRRRVDVVLGGGTKHFPEELMRAHGASHTVVRTGDELARAVRVRQDVAGAAGAGGGPLLGLFSEDHCPFELDRGAGVPSLLDMTRAALALLEGSANGFALQVEGGRVDHAAHSNDAGALIAEQLAFDECLGAVMAWAGERDDTLVIVTSDHANGNPGLTLYGDAGRRGLERAAGATRSFEWVGRQLSPAAALDDFEEVSKVGDLAALRGRLAEATGIELRDEEWTMVEDTMARRQRHPFMPQASTPSSIIAGLLSNHNAIAWVSPNHTADPVETTAWGPGSELVEAWIPNTALHGVMVRAMGLEPARAE